METNIIDIIGFYGPFILFGTAIYFIIPYKQYIFYYIIFFFINGIVNVILKNIIRDPRPAGFHKTHTYDMIEYKGIEYYGMPSGHSQSVFYTISYMWYVTHNIYLLMIGLFIGLITLNQRYKTKKHTLEQLGVGAIIGTIIGYISYNISKKILQM
jgi:membrane-associated phospholipid phosphatase